MPEIKVKINSIEKPELKAKIVEEKEEGAVTDRRLVTVIKFEAEVDPKVFSPVMVAMSNGHQVSVTFTTPQMGLNLEPIAGEAEKREVVKVS